ncbi:PASTA domain-containing protein [Ornithinimicrobium cerasi]|uniref:PASTA domain-containing protein n=1 Tax=Ornithinimicrobium cerasi TaxID=2248773 RepID=A0A285VCC4_9MICO|nr:PASTA domain-containing protein [Ornithinimicrobium cerasi]SOC51724.1 PASTA domain-containing protein [Ornithinimicrobium cerasi]
MTSQQTGGLSPSRRTLVKGAAWSVPVVAVAVPAHARGASQCDAFSFGRGSFKCAGQSTGFNFGYGLRFCLVSSCLPGAIEGQIVTIRLDLGVETNVTLEPVFEYANPQIVVSPGATTCTDIIYQFGSSNSNSQVTFFYQVGSNEPVEITITAPPSCPPVAVPNLVGMTLAEAEGALNAIGLRLGDTTYTGDDPGTGLVVSQFPAAGTLLDPLSEVDVTVSGPTP